MENDTATNNAAPSAQTTPQSPTPAAPVASPAPAATSNMPPLTIPSITPTKEVPQTYVGKLDAGEQHWKWKVGLRGIAMILGIIGIGCYGWILSQANGNYYRSSWDYYYSTGITGLWSLTTFSVSILWCALVILILLLRKRPAHPGVAVAIDLLLWLAFIGSVTFAIISLMELNSWGEGGWLSGSSYYSSGGSYKLESNGTWIWQTYNDNPYNQEERDCDRTSRRYSSYGYGSGRNFESCAEQDAYLNKIWQEKPHRVRVETLGTFCQCAGLILHFALFVWACVDTHRRNKNSVTKEAEVLAADIVMRMVQSGALIQAPGQAYQRPAPFQQQYPNQPFQAGGYANAPPQMANFSYPQNVSSGPSGQMPMAMPPQNEKGQSQRFA